MYTRDVKEKTNGKIKDSATQNVVGTPIILNAVLFLKERHNIEDQDRSVRSHYPPQHIRDYSLLLWLRPEKMRY